jgi:hypothetical protein
LYILSWGHFSNTVLLQVNEHVWSAQRLNPGGHPGWDGQLAIFFLHDPSGQRIGNSLSKHEFSKTVEHKSAAKLDWTHLLSARHLENPSSQSHSYLLVTH